MLILVRGTLPGCYRKRREEGSDHMGYSRVANHTREERKKESEGQKVKDRYICTIRDEEWGFGVQVLPWLDDLLPQSLHAEKEQGWAVTCAGWPLLSGAPLWKLC